MIYTRKDLYEISNLYLAWKRIQTSTRHEYKELCSKSYSAFSWYVGRKIKLFSSELRERIYQPIHSSKFYQPKKSGLVRPITVLSVKDQIFYQAITNLICKAKFADIKKFRRGTIFGGFNIQKPESIYFLSFWKDEYKSYKKIIKNNFEEGYIWICKFDLASFYDTIDHNILIETVCSDIFDDDLRDLFLKSLNVWSKPQSLSFPYSQGIPQGPCASQVIADLYLNYLDSKMKAISIQHDFKYLRYVDDIVLMGKNEKEVKSGLIKLDIIARELALVPQSGKIEIKKIINIKDELKGENSLIDLISSLDNKDHKKSQKYLRSLFLKSIIKDEEGKIKIVDETGFKFSLYRLNPYNDLMDIVLELIGRYFHLVDICIIYLNRFEYIEKVDNNIFKLISEYPIHDWYTAQLLNYEYIHNCLNINQIYIIGLKVIDSHDKHWFLKEKFLSILENHPDKEFLFIEKLRKNLESEKLLESKLPYYLSLLMKSYEADPVSSQRVFEQSERMMIKVFDEFHLLLGYLHQKNGISYSGNSHNDWFLSNFLEFRKHNNLYEKDGIYYNLVNFYGVPNDYKEKVDFKKLLENDYGLALRYISNAMGFYDSNPEDYILQMDTFNQIILSSILRDETNKISKYELDSMIGKLQSKVQGSCYGIKKCHDLRANSERVHAYNKTQNIENKKTRSWWFEKARSLKRELSISYRYLIAYIANLSA